MARSGKEPNLFQRGKKGIWWARIYIDGREQKKSLRTRNRTAARDALERIPIRFARTERHRAVVELAAAGITMTAFDDHYESAPDLDAVYTAIVDALLDAASLHGELVYAVPGSPARLADPVTVTTSHPRERDSVS